MLSDNIINEISKNGSYLGYACDLDFGVSGITRAHTGVGQILLNGYVYDGVGELGSVGAVESIGDANPIRLELELSGVPSALLGQALKARARGNKSVVYIVVYDKDGKVIAYESIVRGFITDYKVTNGESNVINVTIADEFELFEMPWHKYWTDESHRKDHQDDRFCRYASQMEDREIQWGSKNDAPSFRS